MPVLEADCCGEVEGHGRAGTLRPDAPRARRTQAGEVYICTGGSPRYALWGELMSTRARRLARRAPWSTASIAIPAAILQAGLPVFSHGSYAQDQRLRGRVIDFRCPIEFGNGARVDPGDVIVGDIDGVLMIPREHVRRHRLGWPWRRSRARSGPADDRSRAESTEAIFGKTGIM